MVNRIRQGKVLKCRRSSHHIFLFASAIDDHINEVPGIRYDCIVNNTPLFVHNQTKLSFAWFKRLDVAHNNLLDKFYGILSCPFDLPHMRDVK